MDDGANTVAVVPFRTHFVHHLGVSHANEVSVDASADAIARQFFNVGRCATVGGFLREGRAEGFGDGVRGEVFHMGGQMEKFFLIERFGMDGLNGKNALGEGAGLVEGHRADIGQGIHIAASLDEDAPSRCTAKAAEEGQRHTDDEGTRTGDDQEDERTVEPQGEGRPITIANEQGRHKGQQEGGDDTMGV